MDLLEQQRSQDLKKSERMNVHPHFHAMLLVKSTYFNRDYINQVEWTDMWIKAMRLDYYLKLIFGLLNRIHAKRWMKTSQNCMVQCWKRSNTA